MLNNFRFQINASLMNFELKAEKDAFWFLTVFNVNNNTKCFLSTKSAC